MTGILREHNTKSVAAPGIDILYLVAFSYEHLYGMYFFVLLCNYQIYSSNVQTGESASVSTGLFITVKLENWSGKWAGFSL